MKGKVWVVVAVACSNCNSMGVRSFDHEPSSDERDSVASNIGGMYCINTHTFKTEVNGEMIERCIGV